VGRILNYIQYHYGIFPSSEQNLELAKLFFRGGFKGGRVQWVAIDPSLGKPKKMEKTVNIMAEVKASTLDTYIIAVTLRVFLM